jgi:translocator protein
VSAAALDELDERGARQEAQTYARLLALNLVLNGSWSWLFFNRRQLGPSAILAGALAVSSADLTRRAVRVNGTPATALWPYPLWCTFATALSSRIWWLNR